MAQIGMQNWRIHFSAFEAIGIAEDETDIYMACSNGIVEYDTEDNSISVLTVTNGLSDLGISTINSNGSTVIIGYSNGNLDVLENNTITNVPWIKLAEIPGDKTVNSVYFDGDYAFISTNIGMVLYDIVKKEIKDTYYPYASPVVFDATTYKDTIYLATQNGIYQAHKDKPFLNDQNQWIKKSNIPATIVNEPISQIETFNDKLVFAYNSLNFNEDTIYYFQDGLLNYYTDNPVSVIDIKADENELLVSLFSNVQILDDNMTSINIIYNYDTGIPEPQACIKSAGSYWISDANAGLVKGTLSLFSNTPYSDGTYRMDVQYGKLLVAGGGLTQNLQNTFSRSGIYMFEDEEWTNFNYENHDSIDFDDDFDFICVAVNQNNTDEFAFASYSKGGLKIVKDGSTISETYNSTNSELEPLADKMLISDMKYDDDGNLWVINQGVNPLKVLTPEGVWHSFSLGSSAKNKAPYRLLIDSQGNKWVAVTNVGLIAFNDNGTLDDTSDDNLRTLSNSEGYGDLPSLFVKGLAEDIDGEIWIGTEEGLVILYSTNQLYDGGFGDYDASPILLEVDGEVEKLLGDTYITSIAIDGGNRKWIGTSSSGVFCFSPDGLTEEYRFTAENSPLVSNNVLDIKVDHFSGEVYFATDKGLVSFRSDATIADDEFSNVKVFPNPVRPEFSGPITIQGLGYETEVKITNVSANLIFKKVSNGGTVKKKKKTLQGDRVQSGVYLVWTGIADGKGKNVAKILFIN